MDRTQVFPVYEIFSRIQLFISMSNEIELFLSARIKDSQEITRVSNNSITHFYPKKSQRHTHTNNA